MMEAPTKIFLPLRAVDAAQLAVSARLDRRLWAGSVYVPTSVRKSPCGRESRGRRDCLASAGTMVLSVGTPGCIVLPPLADRPGRRPTLGLYSW
jgi:hypothetical protein